MSKKHDEDGMVDMHNASADVHNAQLAKQESETLGASLLALINQRKPYFFSSLQDLSREGRLNAVRYMTDKTNNIDDILHPNTFDVTDVIISSVSFVDSEGDTVVTPKCVLINKEGKHVSIMAKVWVTEFLGLFLFMGNPPWKMPIKVSAKQVKGNGVNRYYTLYLP